MPVPINCKRDTLCQVPETGNRQNQKRPRITNMKDWLLMLSVAAGVYAYDYCVYHAGISGGMGGFFYVYASCLSSLVLIAATIVFDRAKSSVILVTAAIVAFIEMHVITINIAASIDYLYGNSWAKGLFTVYYDGYKSEVRAMGVMEALALAIYPVSGALNGLLRLGRTILSRIWAYYSAHYQLPLFFNLAISALESTQKQTIFGGKA